LAYGENRRSVLGKPKRRTARTEDTYRENRNQSSDLEKRFSVGVSSRKVRFGFLSTPAIKQKRTAKTEKEGFVT
jgi:hypothetical protein